MQFFKRFARRRPRRPSESYRARLGVEQLETRIALALPPGSFLGGNVGAGTVYQTAKPGGESTAIGPNGGSVITWSQGSSDDYYGIYIRQYDAQGKPIGGAREISSSIGGDKVDSAVAMDAAGDFIVIWSSYGEDGSGWGVFGERFNAQAVAQGGQFQVNTTSCGDQKDARVGMDSLGNFVVTWTGSGQNGWGVYAQRYNAQGQTLGGQFEVNTNTSGDKEYVGMAMNGSGAFVISWSSNGQDGSGWGVYAQRYNSSGVAQGSEFRVNTTAVGDQMYPSVAMDSLGDFVITWSSNGQDGSGWGVYAQRYTSAGCKAGCEFLVNTTTTGDQLYSTVAMDGTGNFTITWSSNKYDGSGWQVCGQQFTSSGTRYGSEFVISTSGAGDQQCSSIAMNSLGQAVVVWTASGSGSNPAGVYGVNLSLL
jgi:hypothetical protein